MKDTTWVTDILLDIARFSEENGLPKTYDSLISAIKVAANELKCLIQNLMHNIKALRFCA